MYDRRENLCALCYILPYFRADDNEKRVTLATITLLLTDKIWYTEKTVLDRSRRDFTLMLKGKTVVLGVSSSIAAYKIANLASMLVKQHANVRVIMTQNATNFITPTT